MSRDAAQVAIKTRLKPNWTAARRCPPLRGRVALRSELSEGGRTQLALAAEGKKGRGDSEESLTDQEAGMAGGKKRRVRR